MDSVRLFQQAQSLWFFSALGHIVAVAVVFGCLLGHEACVVLGVDSRLWLLGLLGLLLNLGLVLCHLVAAVVLATYLVPLVMYLVTHLVPHLADVSLALDKSLVEESLDKRFVESKRQIACRDSPRAAC